MAEETGLRNQLGGGGTEDLNSGFITLGAGGVIQPGNDPGSPDWVIDSQLISSNKVAYVRSHFATKGILGSYKIYVGKSGSKNIFTSSSKAYKIQITLSAREYFYRNVGSTFDGIIEVEFQIGCLPRIVKNMKVTDYDQFVKFEFFYQPTEFDLKKFEAKNMWIRKVSPGTLKIVDSKIESINIEYDPIINNQLLSKDPSSGSSYFTIPINSDGKEIQTFIGNKKGEITTIKYGNGAFKSGIWKTGVWNDGWRGLWDDTDDIYYFDKINLNTFQLSKNMWILIIDSNSNIVNRDNILSNISVNDFVTLSNVVGIDINEERYLLKDYYRVSAIDRIGNVVTLTIEIPVSKFPLRRFEIDSPHHLIYLTKNMWMGGTFLNGYFRGIWSFGLFRGFPFTTVMENSHFVDGKFDGGRFISRIAGITSSNLDFREYHTGLVQFFEFFDNNISETEGFNNYIDNTYQSWIDVNFYTQSFVNINSLTSIYDENFGKKVPLANLYGYPTLDVLSSISKFKNSSDSSVDYYNLGTKYKIYEDYLGDNGYFRRAFNSEGKPGLEEFIAQGWTANTGNFYGTPTVSFVYNSNITRKNVNQISIILATFGYNVLNNNNIRVDDKKYTLVEYDLAFFNRGRDEDTQEYTNSFSKPLNLLGSNYPSTTNIYKNGITKTEYFYNKNALDLILRYNSEYVPPDESIAMFGFNYTHSTSPSGETNPSYSTTYSFTFPQTSVDLAGPLFVEEWSPDEVYQEYKVVRRPSDDAFAPYFISLKNNNTGLLSDPQSWKRTTIGFNHPIKENTIFEQSENFGFFTSARINYFKFIEIDALPFFNYWDFEINFSSTKKDSNYVVLEFPKPHGLKRGDTLSLRLDETKYNPDYEKDNISIISVSDGPIPNGDVLYEVKTNLVYGNTVSYLAESGTVKKDGNRIDKRIQANFYSNSPLVEGLDENFVYLGNNQIFVDRNQLL